MIFFCISINYSSSISRFLAHNAWHSVQQSLAGGAPVFVGAPVRPNMLNLPKSASAYYTLRPHKTATVLFSEYYWYCW